MRQALILIAACLAVPAAARTAPPPAACPEAYPPPLFLSPMGEPFRATGTEDDPVRRWFDQADRNRDARLTVGELMLDADRFFATLDKDRNGELLPDEVAVYEQDIAPEIRLYQFRPERTGNAAGGGSRERRKDRPRQKRGSGAPDYGGAAGAGRYAFLNIPNPVAAADADLNRAVTAGEFRSAAAARFADLDPNQTKALALSQLPQTPAQKAANAACLARVADKAKGRRR